MIRLTARSACPLSSRSRPRCAQTPLAVDFGELDSVQEKRGGVCHPVAWHVGGRYGALRPPHCVFGAGPGKNPGVGGAGDNSLNDGVDFVDGLPVIVPCLFADPDADGNAVAMGASARPDLWGNTAAGVLFSDVGALLGGQSGGAGLACDRHGAREKSGASNRSRQQEGRG